MSLILAMVAVALVARPLDTAFGGLWGERAAAALFVLFGLLFLRIALKKP
jgi:hypothetical protein